MEDMNPNELYAFGEEDENGKQMEFGSGDEDEHNETNNANINGIKVEPKKRIVRNPRHRLTIEILTGSKGIHTIENYFSTIKYKGRNHEKEDLNEILKHLQHWAHRMYPSYKFNDILDNIERLGRKKPLQVHMSRYRLGLVENLSTAASNSKIDADDNPDEIEISEPFDEFDALLDKQIALSKVASDTSTAHSSSVTANSTQFLKATNCLENSQNSKSDYIENAVADKHHIIQNSPHQSPKKMISNHLTPEQLERAAANRKLAQERLAAKRLAATQHQQQSQLQSQL